MSLGWEGRGLHKQSMHTYKRRAFVFLEKLFVLLDTLKK